MSTEKTNIGQEFSGADLDEFDIEGIPDKESILEDPNREIKKGDPNYFPDPNDPDADGPQPGDPDYVAPELKFGDEGYVLKEGDPGYVVPAAEQQQKVGLTDEQKAEAHKELLDRLGISSVEELETKLKAPETAEAKIEREKEYNRKLNAFALESKLLTPEDIGEHQRVTNAKDADLVFSEFSAKYEADNKDRTNADGPYPVTADEIKTAFESFYHTTSENEALKKRGEDAIQSRASSLREAANGKISYAKEVFDHDQSRRAKIPAFTETVKGVLKDAIPSEIVLKEGEGETKVVLKTEGLINSEVLEKELLVAANLDSYITDPVKFVADLKAKILKDFHWDNREKIQKILYDNAHGQGLKEGAKGSREPFQQRQTQPNQNTTGVKYTDQDKANFQEIAPFS